MKLSGAVIKDEGYEHWFLRYGKQIRRPYFLPEWLFVKAYISYHRDLATSERRNRATATPRLPRGYPEATPKHSSASPKHLQGLRVAVQARLETWHSIKKS